MTQGIPSSDAQAQLVGEKRSKPGRNGSDESFQENRKESLGNEPLQTISKRLCECWLLTVRAEKSPLYCSVQSGSSNFRVAAFVFSYTSFVLSAIV